MKLSRVNGQYAKNVGFYLKNGRRINKRWYLGTDEYEAIILAARLQKAWRDGSPQVIQNDDGRVWRADAKTVESALETPEGMRNKLGLDGRDTHDGSTVSLPELEAPIITLTDALKWFDAAQEKKIVLRNRSNNQRQSVMKLRYNINECLAPFPQYTLLEHFGTQAVEAIHDYWMGTDHSNRPNGRTDTVGERTAINYLNSFKTFLRKCSVNSAFNYHRPVEVDGWRFTLKRGQVFVPTVNELEIIFRAASERMKCFMLMALNAGQLAGEIGRTTPEHITVSNGHPVIRKIRFKVEKKISYMGTWQMWPETARAIEDNREARGTEFLFLNKLGKPLYDVREKSKSDAIGDEFAKLVKRLIKEGKPIRQKVTFKSLRAWGASWIANESRSEYFSKLYLCHSIATGATQMYVDSQYEILQPYLAKMRKALPFLAVQTSAKASPVKG